MSYGISLKTETIKMHNLKSHTKLPSKYNESTCSSQEIASIWISTGVSYTVPIDDKPTKIELYTKGK